MTAPVFRSVCQLTGEKAESPVLKILDSAAKIAAQATTAELARAAFDAAVGFYSCPCGGAFEFDPDSTLEDYAALNRWLGHHEVCAERSELYRQLELAHARINELTSEVAWATEVGSAPGSSPAGADHPNP
jgi:hypothetical protein